MLTIDPVSLGTLTLYLAKVDAADLAKSEASDALEAAAGKTNNEPTRLACLEVFRVACEEYDVALIELAEEVRCALYGAAGENGDPIPSPRYP